jgi:uncharacterized membrane protein (DUF373 family)
LDTIRAFHLERIIRVEIAIVVALPAIARKVIILDYTSLTGFTLLEVGAATPGFAVAYYLLRRSRGSYGKGHGADASTSENCRARREPSSRAFMALAALKSSRRRIRNNVEIEEGLR